MEITIQTLVYPSTHILPTEKNDIRYVRGDVIGVFLKSETPESPSPNSKTMFIRVNDYPDNLIVNLKRISKPYIISFTNEIGEYDTKLIQKHKYYFDQSLITQTEYDELLLNRELTTTWSRIKQVLKNKETNNLILESELN